MCDISTCYKVAVQIENISNMNVHQIFCRNWCYKNLLSASLYQHYMYTPLCVVTLAFNSRSKTI